MNQLEDLHDAAATLKAIAAEHGDGGDGVSVLLARYGLDEEAMHALSLTLALQHLTVPPDHLVDSIAGMYTAGVLLGLRLAEERA